MKKQALVLFPLLLLLSYQNSFGKVILLSEVASNVRNQDYTLYQNALKVYQAKEAIQVTRMNLLPQLNIWKVAEVLIDPKAIVGIIEDLVPFLIPSNWLKVKQYSFLYQAENESYRTLEANEIFTAKSIYYQVASDEMLFAQVQEAAKKSKQLLDLVKTQEQFGGVPAGTSRQIEIRLLALQEDERQLSNLVKSEKANLKLMTGVDVHEDFSLQSLNDFPIVDTTPVKDREIESLALARSTELKQYDFLIEAAGYIKKEINFSVLGTSSLSQGTGNGAFNGYPVQPGLGFGMGPSLRIGRAQVEILESQKDAAAEILKRQVQLTVLNYNSDLMGYINLKKRFEISSQVYRSLRERLQMGSPVSVVELNEASKTEMESKTQFLNTWNKLLIGKDRIQRLILEGDYQDLINEPEASQGTSSQ